MKAPAAADVAKNVRRLGNPRCDDMDPSPAAAMTAMIVRHCSDIPQPAAIMKRRSRHNLMIASAAYALLVCVQRDSTGRLQTFHHWHCECRYRARRAHTH